MNLATSPQNAVESLLGILILAFVHLSVKQLDRLEDSTRNALLAVGAGASLSYVLVRIMPKLAEKQEDLLASVGGGMLGFLEHHAYIVAMIGLVVYYGVSQLSYYGTEERGSVRSQRYTAALTVTVFGYGAYSLLIGYLVVNRLVLGLPSLSLIVLGLGTLFLVSDHGLRSKWSQAYDSWMRWVLTGALLGGWALGVLHQVSSNIVALWFAFLGGLMLITTIGEKLALEQKQAFWPFVGGVATFTGLLLLLEWWKPETVT